MKILLANKFYYPRGGSDIYMIELEKLLKENGHEVEVFSMQHPLNLKSGKSGFFPGEVDLNKKTLHNLTYSLLRPFGSKEVRRKYKQLLKEFKPDVVHLNNIHSHLSPILAVIAHRHKVPVVWALHDHKLLCPRYDCMRNNKPCELCFTHKYNVVRYRCMKNSLLASLIAYAEAIFWNKKIVSRSTDTFICPSTFLLNNMIKGGFDKNQLVVLNNFINLKKITGNNFVRQNYYCYVGRLSTEKGIKTLLKAARELPQHILKVIGTGPLENSLKEKYKEKHIEFLGFSEWNDLKEILGSSKVMVIPSECYENNPLSVIESLCLGTPVIGSNIGGIPELITPGKNGLIFETGNVSDLQNKISQIFQSALSFNYSEIEYKARNRFNSGNYYDQLINIYNKLIFSKN
jgi:glycosyltransferase involved in cell wall biosynthesis